MPDVVPPAPDEILARLRTGPVTGVLLAEANATANRLYWHTSDAVGCHRVLDAALQVVTAELKRPGADANGELARKRLVLLYNMASFGWRGWSQPGITVSPEFAASAATAAALHLAGAKALRVDNEQLSRAYWIAGALQLQERDYTQAKAHFLEASIHGYKAGNHGEATNAEAFAAVAQLLAGDSSAQTTFDGCVQQLREDPEWLPLAEQAPTALAVYTAEKA